MFRLLCFCLMTRCLFLLRPYVFFHKVYDVSVLSYGTPSFYTRARFVSHVKVSNNGLTSTLHKLRVVNTFPFGL